MAALIVTAAMSAEMSGGGGGGWGEFTARGNRAESRISKRGWWTS